MSVLSFAITIFGVIWLSAAAVIGAATVEIVESMAFVLTLAHMAIGLTIAMIGLCRRDW